MRQAASASSGRRVTRERFALLRNLERLLGGPLSLLGLIWLCVIVATFIWGNQGWLLRLTYAIWVVFVVDFVIRLIIAPKKLGFLKKNALVMLSLALPMLAFLRFFRVLALIPAWQTALMQLLGSINRSLTILSATMERRGFVYAVLLTAVVTIAGAAGMYRFEHSTSSHVPGINSYPYALWWTAMIMTTLGSDYFPHTAAGRILCLLLSIFAFSIFGYITAAVSSYFINKDATDERSPVPSEAQLNAILREVAALRAELRDKRERQPAGRVAAARLPARK